VRGIVESLAEDIPDGPWCHGHSNSSRAENGKARFCKYHEIKKPAIADNGINILSHYCHLHEEFVTRKICGINERPTQIEVRVGQRLPG